MKKSDNLSKQDKPISSPEKLVKTDKKSGNDLTEQELDSVSGGRIYEPQHNMGDGSV